MWTTLQRSQSQQPFQPDSPERHDGGLSTDRREIGGALHVSEEFLERWRLGAPAAPALPSGEI
jgi:hypothetical protein